MIVADRRQRLLEDRDHPNVGAEDRDARAAQGQRGASDEVRAIRRARQLDRPCERALCIIGESRTLKRLSEQALELGSPLRRAAAAFEDRQRPPQQRGGVLVGEHRARATGGPLCEVGGSDGIAGARRGFERVIGQRDEVAIRIELRRSLERRGEQFVKASAPRRCQ